MIDRRSFLKSAVVGMAAPVFACGRAQDGRIRVVVSILPLKNFVERIGGRHVSISVLVGPGQSPETYEPLPRQMLDVALADVFFRVGVPFEDKLIENIRLGNPALRIVDLRAGIELKPMDTVTELTDGNGEEGNEREEEPHETHAHNSLDPHIWLSPTLVKIQASTICDALAETDPGHAEEYSSNLAAFQADLDRLHDNIAAAFAPFASKTMLVFHPAWGYFAREFGIVQLPIEIEGKEPGPRDLAVVIETARNAGVRVIFVQPSSSQTSARAIADAIGAIVISIDPLAEDYFGNLIGAAQIISASLAKSTPVDSGARP